MLFRLASCILAFLALNLTSASATSSIVGSSGAHDLRIVAQGQSEAVIISAADAGPNETQAAADLARYIGLMSGVEPAIATSAMAIQSALATDKPLIVLGSQALKLNPGLMAALSAKLIERPKIRTDGIVVRRDGNRLYVAGNNDLSHYFAAAEVLRRWGVRWFMPTNFGECVPDVSELLVGDIDFAASSPFEVRTYWTSWLGSNSGEAQFQKRNMMTSRADLPPTGHALDQYTIGLGPSAFDFPITRDTTADHVADQVDRLFAKGDNFSLGIADGLYLSRDPMDQALLHLRWDSSFLRWSITDAMLTLYNKVAERLHAKHPGSPSRIGFLAYANMTLPPVRVEKARPELYAELAPIDIDPIHPMGDSRWPERSDFRNILQGWARFMDGRLTIYDYDQNMLLWRDLPDPSHQAFRRDVKEYRAEHILGVNTETRGAFASTFINLYLRGRLLWNPDEDVDRLLDDFFTRFYGSVAEPMSRYWRAIFDAWETTIVSEHEFFVAPAIYTAPLMETLRSQIAEAEALIAPIASKDPASRSRNEVRFLERMEFTRAGFDVLRSYMAMVSAAATNVDYPNAVKAGKQGLLARDKLSRMNETFTTTKLESGPGFWPDEVQQYEDLRALTDDTHGHFVATLPLEWAFHRDPDRVGVSEGFVNQPIDLSYWEDHKTSSLAARKDYPVNRWEMLRTDLYAQAQGVRMPDARSYTGDLWYRTTVDLAASETQKALHLRFPGLFGACHLFVNGSEVAVREQDPLPYRNDYHFEWDVDLTNRGRTGANDLALQCDCQSHFAGMFRRPFLYEVVDTPAR